MQSKVDQQLCLLDSRLPLFCHLLLNIDAERVGGRNLKTHIEPPDTHRSDRCHHSMGGPHQCPKWLIRRPHSVVDQRWKAALQDAKLNARPCQVA